jgi:hypothetical protein
MFVRLWDFKVSLQFFNFLALMVWEYYGHVHDGREMLA